MTAPVPNAHAPIRGVAPSASAARRAMPRPISDTFAHPIAAPIHRHHPQKRSLPTRFACAQRSAQTVRALRHPLISPLRFGYRQRQCADIREPRHQSSPTTPEERHPDGTPHPPLLGQDQFVVARMTKPIADIPMTDDQFPATPQQCAAGHHRQGCLRMGRGDVVAAVRMALDIRFDSGLEIEHGRHLCW